MARIDIDLSDVRLPEQMTREELIAKMSGLELEWKVLWGRQEDRAEAVATARQRAGKASGEARAQKSEAVERELFALLDQFVHKGTKTKDVVRALSAAMHLNGLALNSQMAERLEKDRCKLIRKWRRA